MSMTDVYIKYNPYTVKTEFKIDGQPVGKESGLYNMQEDRRLQSWIEPYDTLVERWKGIFAELYNETNSRELRITFHGTTLDFTDLEYAARKYGQGLKIQLNHENACSGKQHAPEEKLTKLKELYDDLRYGPIEEFKAPDIQKNFECAIHSDFKIVVIAPMSSGKSTLLNAIMGEGILPESNQATTATWTYIREGRKNGGFRIVSAEDRNGHQLRYKKSDGKYEFRTDGNGKLIQNIPADPELVKELNYARDKDPEEPERKCALVQKFEIEGQIPGLSSDSLHVVFVDTPGGNNCLNEEHEELMDKAMNDENNCMILYVFDGTSASAGDANKILKKITEAMKRNSNGKLSRDRFLFVANKMDAYDPEKENYDDFINNTLLTMLENNGITEPNFYLTSAETAKLIRIRRKNQKLTTKESSNLGSYTNLFGGASKDEGSDAYSLYRYSSLSRRQKNAFDEEIKQLEAKPSEENKLRIAEIRSGVPALEAAIKEYIEKYALCIKIKQAHDSFMKKVEERQMLAAYDEKLLKSKSERERVKAEILEKKKKLHNSQELQECGRRIDRIELNTVPIWAYSEDVGIYLHEKGWEISQGKEEVEKNIAEEMLKAFNRELERKYEEFSKKVPELFDKAIIEPCNCIILDYADHVKKMEESGMFSLGDIHLEKMGVFSGLTIEVVIGDLYLTDKEEACGTRRYKKSGFFNRIKRIFGIDSGWGTETIYKTVTYVKIYEMFRNKVTRVTADLDLEIREEIKRLRDQLDQAKKETKEKLVKINLTIEQAMQEIEYKATHEETLRKQVEKDQQNRAWINRFKNDVDRIIDI